MSEPWKLPVPEFDEVLKTFGNPMMYKTSIRPLIEADWQDLWRIGYAEAEMDWRLTNGPYFEDNWLYVWPDFQAAAFCRHWWGIFVDRCLIGSLSRHWVDEKTRWMEVGIVIYDAGYWRGGYGSDALRQWLVQTFADYPELAHLGLTTFSGNPGMMRAAAKAGMTQEACIRKVRYWQGVYYDSVKYGVLREEMM